MKYWEWITRHWGPVGFFITFIVVPVATFLWRKPIARLLARLNEYRKLTRDYPSLLAEIEKVNKHLEEMRHEIELSSLRWRVYWQFSDVGVYECDPKGFCTYANPRLCSMFGLQLDDMLGTGWLRSVGRSSQERTQAWVNWKTAVDGGLPYSDEYWLTPPTGARVYIRTYAMALRSAIDDSVLLHHGVVIKHPNPPPDSKDPVLSAKKKSGI